MNSDRSRRTFLKYAPGGAVFLLTMPSKSHALGNSSPNPTTNQSGGGQTTSPRPFPGGGMGGGGGMGPGPARQAGETQSQAISRPDLTKHDPAPRKPRKNLEADQKSLRDEVLQLVQDSQELKKAVEQVGPNQPLSAEMVTKMKEIERLAHSIAALAKG